MPRYSSAAAGDASSEADPPQQGDEPVLVETVTMGYANTDQGEDEYYEEDDEEDDEESEYDSDSDAEGIPRRLTDDEEPEEEAGDSEEEIDAQPESDCEDTHAGEVEEEGVEHEGEEEEVYEEEEEGDELSDEEGDELSDEEEVSADEEEIEGELDDKDIRHLPENSKDARDREDPQFIPKKGNFFLHDDRFDKRSNKAQSDRKPKHLWNGKNEDGLSVDEAWVHDKFEQLDLASDLPPPRQQRPKPRPKRDRKPKGKAKQQQQQQQQQAVQIPEPWAAQDAPWGMQEQQEQQEWTGPQEAAAGVEWAAPAGVTDDPNSPYTPQMTPQMGYDGFTGYSGGYSQPEGGYSQPEFGGYPTPQSQDFSQQPAVYPAAGGAYGGWDGALQWPDSSPYGYPQAAYPSYDTSGYQQSPGGFYGGGVPGPESMGMGYGSPAGWNSSRPQSHAIPIQDAPTPLDQNQSTKKRYTSMSFAS